MLIKFSCEKSILVSAISVASRTVSPKSPLSVLEGILVQAEFDLYLTGYNLETGIKVRVPAEIKQAGECILPARLLFDIVRRLPDDIVTIEVSDDLRVSITCGISAFQISAEKADDYPELPAVSLEDAVSLPQRELRDMISGTLFSVSEGASRPIHTGVLFEIEGNDVTAVAIDGYRLALRKYHSETPYEKNMKIVVPAPALREVEKLLGDTDDPVAISLDQRHILFSVGDATLVCRVLEGEFMDWRKVLATKPTITMTADVQLLSQAVERVSLVVSEKFKAPAHCIFGKDTLSLKTATVIGTAQDSCPLAGDGGDLEIGFNCRFLLEALRQVPTQEVALELTNDISPIVMKPTDDSEKFTYLILPVRIKKEN